MPATTSPFFGINYGWTTGEGSWGDPVNSNFKVLSFLGKGAVDSFVATLPVSPSEGASVVLTTDKQFYVRLGGVWLFIQPQEGQEVNEISTGKRWKFNGTSWVEIASTESLKDRVEVLEQFDIDLVDTTNPSNGAGVVGWKRSLLSTAIGTVGQMLSAQSVSIWEKEFSSLITSKPNPSDPATWDWLPAFNAANTYAGLQPNPVTIDVTGKIGLSATAKITARYATISCKNGTILALPGFASETPVVKFGDSGLGFAWTGYGDHLHVDCGNQRLIAVEFSRPFSGAFYSSVRTERSKFIGVKVTSGFGLKLDKFDIRMPMILDGGEPANADSDSIGLHVLTTDCDFGSGDVAGAAIGVKAIGGNNTFGPVHAWGAYQKAGVPQSVPMITGVWNEGQSNTFVGCISDSPSLVDYTQPASTTNGGYGFINRGNGFQAQFMGCKTYIPDRTVFGETLPAAKLVGNLVNQDAQYIGCELFDASGTARISGFNGLYAGTNLASSLILSRDVNRIGSSIQTQFVTKPYLSKGVEFQAQTQNADQQAASFGACSFSMPDAAFFDIITNFSGGARTVSLPRLQRGTTALRTGTLQPLLVAAGATKSSGYYYWDTDLGKPCYWDGTAWVAPAVAAV